jgi:hypothetical protein
VDVPKSTIRLIVLIAAGAAAASPLVARSAEWYANSNVRQRISYNDNIGLRTSSSEKVSEFGETSTVDMSLGGRSPTAEIDFTSVLDFTRFPDERSLNSNDQFLTLSGLKRGQRWTAGIVGNVIRDTTRTSDVEDTGEFILQNRRREVLGIGPQVTYQLTPVDEIGLNGRFSDTHYPSNNITDFQQWGGGGSWVRRLTERTQFLLNGSGYKTNSGSRGSQNSNYYTALVGFAHSFTDTLEGRLTAGPTIADVDVVGGPSNSRRSHSDFNLGYGFDGAIDYRFRERLSFSGQIFRTVRPSTTTGNIIEETGVRISSSYDLFKHVYLDTATLYKRRQAIGDSDVPNRDYVSFQPELRWEFLEDWNLRVGYRLRWQRYDRNDNDEAFSNSVLASVGYNLPPLTMSR